ncbi:MAG: hypothetical protein WBO48_20085 [Candidatus Promineifilaceae bacterium]|nr:hypothetical protein [Chloroflexota bacterium]MBK8934506.1 hypothetical protein [Chloroflexota bacterium]MBP7590076.1 hypothetical protein [Chloroflexota bacterium]
MNPGKTAVTHPNRSILTHPPGSGTPNLYKFMAVGSGKMAHERQTRHGRAAQSQS